MDRLNPKQIATRAIKLSIGRRYGTLESYLGGSVAAKLYSHGHSGANAISQGVKYARWLKKHHAQPVPDNVIPFRAQ